MSTITVTTLGPRPNHLRKSFLHMSALVLMLGAAVSPLKAHAGAVEHSSGMAESARATQVVGSEANWRGLEWMLSAANLDIDRVALVADQPNVVGELRGDTSPAKCHAEGAGRYTVHLSPMEISLSQSGDLAAQYTILHELGHAVQNEHRGRTMVATEFLNKNDAAALGDVFSVTEMFGRTRGEVNLLADGESEGFADAFASAALIKHYGRTPAVELALRAEASNRLEHGPKEGAIGRNTYHGVGYYSIRRALSGEDNGEDAVEQAKMWSSQGLSDFILTTNGNPMRSLLDEDDDATFYLAERRAGALEDAVAAAGRRGNPDAAFDVANTADETAYIKDVLQGGPEALLDAKSDSFIEESKGSYDGLKVNLGNLNRRVEAWREANPNVAGQARPVPGIGVKITPGGR